MKVTIDRKKCCGYAMCVETCPDVYQLDDAGYAYVAVEVVPPDLAAAARKGVGMCPQRAITVTEEEGTG